MVMVHCWLFVFVVVFFWLDTYLTAGALRSAGNNPTFGFTKQSIGF